MIRIALAIISAFMDSIHFLDSVSFTNAVCDSSVSERLHAEMAAKGHNYLKLEHKKDSIHTTHLNKKPQQLSSLIQRINSFHLCEPWNEKAWKMRKLSSTNEGANFF